ncbi:5044_t:CDS:2 [Paraglomus brasilianum]|uniref:5044_t:CDS:1 n=1 Tax=Paraglomus brasilianum TaxID=144538 RepID=A0A9N9BH19_9GLOM|nr:5044_t:CDS:2 [Paraglomus brasilianum]
MKDFDLSATEDVGEDVSELFPTHTETTTDKDEQKEIPPGVSEKFYKFYNDIISKLNPKTFLAFPLAHSSLNGLIYHVLTLQEAALIPEVIERWRLYRLPINVVTTRLLVRRLLEIEALETLFDILADRAKYSQFPSYKDFRRLMAAFASNIGKTDGSQSIEEDMAMLDNVFKTFGLMTYYDLSHFDPHSYAILILASMKIDTEDAWKRADVSTQELMSLLSTEDIRQVEEREDEEERSQIDRYERNKALRTQIDQLHTKLERTERITACIQAATVMSEAYSLRGESEKANELELWKNDLSKSLN